jgi:hypothetical protein
MKSTLFLLLTLISFYNHSPRTNDLRTCDCEGYDSNTESYVYGECVDGEFEGYDSNTGQYIWGECSCNGELEGYNSETESYVYGECED